MTSALSQTLRKKYGNDSAAVLKALDPPENLLSPLKKAPTKFANLALQLVARAHDVVNSAAGALVAAGQRARFVATQEMVDEVRRAGALRRQLQHFARCRVP
jgi:hypothetical protein